LCDIIDVNRS